MKIEKIPLISLLQLVVFVNFWRTKVDAKMVEGCVESQLTLSCDERKVINISSVVLGDSLGCLGKNCCPKNYSCIAKPNDNHVNDVHRQCSGRQRCAVNVTKETIECTTLYGLLNTNQNNDFERIVYDCIDNGSSTTDALKTTRSTDFHAYTTEETSEFTHEDISTFEDYTDKVEYTSVTKTSISEDAVTSGRPEMLNGTGPMPIVIAIVCLLVLVIIIVLIIVIVKRKKHSSKTRPEVEMTDVRNGQNRIYANQNQDTHGNPNSRQNDKQNCASTTYEEPNNVVEYSVVNQETSPAADGAGVQYCSIDIIKSDHKTPATKPGDDGYSLAGDPDDQTCAENVYEDVESKQSASKAKSVNIHSDGGAYEEPQAVPSGQSKLQQECHRKDEKSVSNSKVDEGIYKNIGEVGIPSSPSSPYEPMTPIPGQNVYANESEVTFRTDSLASSLGSGSEAHTPYCEMRSPSVKLKDDGAHMLVDNELYSSH